MRRVRNNAPCSFFHTFPFYFQKNFMLRILNSAFFVVFTLAGFLLSGCSKSKPHYLQQVHKTVKDSVAFDKNKEREDMDRAEKSLKGLFK